MVFQGNVMIVSISEAQYETLRSGLIEVRNASNRLNVIVIARVIAFRCGNELSFGGLSGRWAAVARVIGVSRENKSGGCRFKRRKGFKRVVNAKHMSMLYSIEKLIRSSDLVQKLNGA
ncbi:MAG: hypothetical protein ACKESB_00700 [Candidatus Hodgkinia cicadicola]